MGNGSVVSDGWLLSGCWVGHSVHSSSQYWGIICHVCIRDVCFGAFGKFNFPAVFISPWVKSHTEPLLAICACDRFGNFLKSDSDSDLTWGGVHYSLLCRHSVLSPSQHSCSLMDSWWVLKRGVKLLNLTVKQLKFKSPARTTISTTPKGHKAEGRSLRLSGLWVRYIQMIASSSSQIDRFDPIRWIDSDG